MTYDSDMRASIKNPIRSVEIRPPQTATDVLEDDQGIVVAIKGVHATGNLALPQVENIKIDNISHIFTVHGASVWP